MDTKLTKQIKNKASKIQHFRPQNDLRNKIILGFIIALTIILFSKTRDFYFVTWDDPQYLIDNNLIKDLSIKGLQNIFSTPVLGMYNPITFLVYSAVYKFFGLDPNAYHTLNVILHILATILAFQFILKLTKRYETAAIVALLFAIHPMHVSVAVWVSQTKTSLCAIFYFSSLLYYISYLQNNYKLKYLTYAAICFLLGVLSKPDAITIAPMLFLIDYYFTRKLERKLVIEKIPFFALALFIGIITLITHSNVGDSIFKINKGYSLLNNLLIANYSIVFYVEKLFFPLKLSAIYPYPDQASILPLKYFLALSVIPALFILVYKAAKFRKDLIFGLLFFLISISVLLRVIPAGGFMCTNRYSYISYVGFFFIIGQYITYVLDNKFVYAWKFKKYIILTFAGFIVFFCYRTTVRMDKWKNSITLFDDVIAKYPNVMEAYTNRGFAKEQMGDNDGAYVDYNTALDLNPKASQPYFNRALLLCKIGKEDAALSDFKKVIALNPDYGQAYLFKGLIESRKDDNESALEDFKKAFSLGVTEAYEQIELLKSDSDN